MTGTNTVLAAGNTAGVAGFFGAASYHQLTGEIQSGQQTESKQQQQTNTAVTTSHFAVRISTNSTSTNQTVQFRVGAANGNQVLTITAATVGLFKDTTHSDSLSAGALFDVQRVSSTDTSDAIGIILLQANNTTPIAFYSNGVPASGGGHITFSTTTNYAALFGSANAAVTEANQQVKHRPAGTLKNLSANVDTSSTGTITITHRKNTADGNQTLSIASGTTGITQDTTHSDSLADGDLLATSFVSTNTSGAFEYIAYEFAGTTSAHMLAGRNSGFIALSSSSTYNHCFAGDLNNTASFGEGKVQLFVPYAATYSKLRCHIQTNTLSTATMVTRSGAVTQNQTVSVTSGGTGWFEDTTHSDSLTSSQNICAQIVTGSVSTLQWLENAITIDDGSNTGSSTETGTAVLTFGGLAFASSGTDSHTGTSALHFSGISFASAGSHTETGTAVLHFAGLAFSASGSHTETGVGRLAFSGLAFSASGADSHTGAAALHFAGLSFSASGFAEHTGVVALHFGGIAIRATGSDISAPTPVPPSPVSLGNLPRVDPLTWNIPIVTKDGAPTPEFMRKWGKQATVNGSVTPQSYVDGQTAASLAAARSYTVSYSATVLVAAKAYSDANLAPKPVSTVAGLPASPVKGQQALVTDATATTYNSVVAGTGSNTVPVFYDGAAWRIG